ncbi:MAG: nuclear transport factor 2 family protein [Bacteroidota bacterium]
MRYLIFTGLLLIGACQTKQQNTELMPLSDEERTIVKGLIQDSFDDLWAGLDSTKILDYHTADFIILEHGEVWDNDRIKQFMRDYGKNPNRPTRINEMDYISIDKYGESIQLAYHNYATFKEGDSIVYRGQWLESALAVKQENGEWRLKMMHSTRVPVQEE